MKFILIQPQYLAVIISLLFFAACGKKQSKFVYPDRRVQERLSLVVVPEFGSSGGSTLNQNASSLSFQARGVVFGGGIRGVEASSTSFRMKRGGSYATP